MARVNETVSGTLSQIERLPSSAEGNPRWSFVVDTGTYPNRLRHLKTRANSQIGYVVTNYRNMFVTVELDGRGSPIKFL